MITWDCRGFGNSTFSTGVHGSAAAVADMAAILDATGTAGAHLVGQSMGGWWVSAFTIAYPARTHSLMMCTRCNWVRFIDGIHFFARDRREEVRLLGY